MSPTSADTELAIARRAAEIRSSGRWTSQMTLELDELFEQSTVAALQAASLLERSVRLRRLARHVVPKALRPATKYLVRRLKRVS